MRIGMIPTAYRTPFFRAVARLLERMGHEVCWMSPNRRWSRWLIGAGTPADRVFDATRWAREWKVAPAPTPEDLEELAALELAGGLCWNNLVLMDPLLRRREPGYARRYLAVCARRLRAWIEEQDVRVVFAEQTWAFELVVGQVCRSLGRAHLVPHTVRIPNGRFAFFDGYLETELVPLREVEASDFRAAAAFLGEYRALRPQPSYVGVDHRYFRFQRDRLRLLGRHLLELAEDPHDETSRRPLPLIADHLRQAARGAVNRRRRFEHPAMPPARPFVYFPLHRQPEASIDIKGQPYCNQEETIRALARTLPVTHDLYVKEHAIALVNRAGGFYRAIAAIPGVRLIGPGARSLELVQNADLVVTVTGTAAYEAALLGRPAATLAPIFFDRIVAVPRFDPYRGSLAELLGAELGRARPASDDDLIAFLAQLLARSAPGVCGDALWLPDSMEPDNVARVADAFDLAANRWQPSAARAASIAAPRAGGQPRSAASG